MVLSFVFVFVIVIAVVQVWVWVDVLEAQVQQRFPNLERIPPELVDHFFVLLVFLLDGVVGDDRVPCHGSPPAVSDASREFRRTWIEVVVPVGVVGAVGFGCSVGVHAHAHAHAHAHGIRRGDGHVANAVGVVGGSKPSWALCAVIVVVWIVIEVGHVVPGVAFCMRRSGISVFQLGLVVFKLVALLGESFLDRSIARCGQIAVVVAVQVPAAAEKLAVLEHQNLTNVVDHFQIAKIVDDGPKSILSFHGGFLFDGKEFHEFFHGDALASIGYSEIVGVLLRVVEDFISDRRVREGPFRGGAGGGCRLHRHVEDGSGMQSVNGRERVEMLLR